jgi:hypothetical protein
MSDIEIIQLRPYQLPGRGIKIHWPLRAEPHGALHRRLRHPHVARAGLAVRRRARGGQKEGPALPWRRRWRRRRCRFGRWRQRQNTSNSGPRVFCVNLSKAGTIKAADFGAFAFSVSLQNEDGDLPCRQRLQFDVVGISFSCPLPPLFSLSSINLAGRQLEHIVTVLHRDLRVDP